MMEDKLTVTLQIDACRGDYVDEQNTPFLFSLKQEGVSGSLSPTFGFEPDGAYLAGLYPDECDGGMHFWYSPETSPFKSLKLLLGYFDKLPKVIQLGLRRSLSVLVRRTTQSSRARYVPSFSIIPFKLMSFFDLAEKYLPYEDKFADGRSIFSVLRNSNKSFFFHGAPTCPTLPEDVYKGLIGADHPFDFIFLHTGILDGVGHKYGPFSEEVSSALRRLDSILKRMWSFLNDTYGDFNFVTIGDHGMVEVKELLDSERIINKLDLKLGKDYVYFLDSTFARFWVFNENAKRLVMSVLSEIKQGSVLTEKDKSRYHLNYNHNRFGDLIFVAAPGVLIFPNFWNYRNNKKGMHGYAPECCGQQSLFIIHSSFNNKRGEIENPVDMRRIFPTLLKLTGLPAYYDNRISSIV